eukprot:11605052-Ditylum_brightwellii.AAC.1
MEGMLESSSSEPSSLGENVESLSLSSLCSSGGSCMFSVPVLSCIIIPSGSQRANWCILRM